LTAQFILSLDCEGKWGIADHLGAHDHRALSDERLRAAYRDLVSLLDRLGIPATFAFVGLFGESARDFARLRPEVERFADSAPTYLRPALDDISSGTREGWHGDWAVDLAGAASVGHEIALHGITHVPWGAIGRDAAVAELALYPQLSSAVSRSRTFVFPRNQIAHVDLLARIGIAGYRLAPPRRSRGAALISEWNVRAMPDANPPPTPPPAPIPAGYFVNWQHGLRRLVPTCVSVLRLDHLLTVAARESSVVHLWLHPENIASAPATLDLLAAMLGRVAQARDRGQCAVLTQIDYVAAHRHPEADR